MPASLATDGQTSTSRLATVRLRSCSPARHRAVFSGRMTRVSGTARMAMRFSLLERKGYGRWVRVRNRKLSRWHRSLSGVETFLYRQRVRGLRSGFAYRALVGFRWYSANGEVIMRARRRSRSCRLYGPRPNLRVLRIRQLYQFDGGRAASYAVRVANGGTAPAPSAEVMLFVDGAAVGTLDAGRLAAGETRRVTFIGPNCQRPDSPVAALIDPSNRVRESRESDNSLSTICSEIR